MIIKVPSNLNYSVIDSDVEIYGSAYFKLFSLKNLKLNQADECDSQWKWRRFLSLISHVSISTSTAAVPKVSVSPHKSVRPVESKQF